VVFGLLISVRLVLVLVVWLVVLELLFVVFCLVCGCVASRQVLHVQRYGVLGLRFVLF